MVTIMSKNALTIQRQLLAYLADGHFHSGQWLAETLGVSRTAIANYIEQLQSLGLDLFKVKGRGYCLAKPLQLLDAAEIRRLQSKSAPSVLVQHITDSTNSQLLQKVAEGIPLESGFTLVAEAQTAGRGRRGKAWFSPYGSNLYFSMYWRLEQGIQSAMGLSLVVGIALARLLKSDYQIDAKVKWPNDLYINDQKVAGILVELSSTQIQAGCDVVIGIGLNVQMPEVSTEHISQPWIDLTTASEQIIDRNLLICRLQTELISLLQLFRDAGFAAFVDEFNTLNQHAGKWVTLSGAQNVSGVFESVDIHGGVVLRTDKGLQSYYGGEISLRDGEQ